MSDSVEWAQILERYRHLSRDFQQKFQLIQSKVSPEKYGVGDSVIKALRVDLEDLDEIFQDFNSWLYISLLEDLEEAKRTSAVGLLELHSKIKRVKHKMQKRLENKRLKVEVDVDKVLTISTYVTFFEQLLNLVLQNALKYSPVGSSIQISTTNKHDHVVLEMSSFGPAVDAVELDQLGTKGFRAAAAIKTNIPGEGFGLYNCKRICSVLNIKMRMTSNYASRYTVSGVEFCTFSIFFEIPYTLS